MMVMSLSKELAKIQLEEFTANNKVGKPRPFRPDGRAEAQYRKKLNMILAEAHADIKEQLFPAIEDLQSQYIADGWANDVQSIFERINKKWDSSLYAALFKTVATDFSNKVSNTNKQRFAASMPKNLEINLYDNEEIAGYLEASVIDNVNLIESIPKKYLTSVESIVMANMRRGARYSDIIPLITKQFGAEKRRAKLIARDQTSKINSDISRIRQRNSGFEYFKWLSSKDERVRDSHRHIARANVGYGQGVYRWDDLPKNERGETISPGSDYQCRCVALPVFADEVEKS